MNKEFDSTQIAAFVGLGNPTEDYAKTYHNVGYLCIDSLMRNYANKEGGGAEFSKYPSGRSALFMHSQLQGRRIMKPLSYMNESGIAVKAFLARFKLIPQQLLIIHDDSDLELGTWKFSFRRGDAGHRGIRSIFAQLQTRDFWRLRIGIRNQSSNRTLKASRFVTAEITEQDLEILEKSFTLLRQLLLS